MLILRYHLKFLENCAIVEYEIFLQRVSKWVNIQNKFQVPRSHIIDEKCDANFKISSQFSRELCNRET